jgi:menaquinone-specific isochorismate synthase
MQPADDTAFLSATPERLYRRRNHHIVGEALAGTRPRGKTPEDDLRLGEKLLTSQKEAREHAFVADSVRTALSDLCRSLSADDHRSLVKLPRVQHMVTRFEGELRPGIGDGHLLTRLHPTAAVGGYPANLARSRLRRLETFDRGWYAGPIGWIGVDEAEFAVGIRSGLVQGDTLRLFSGAGIVEGSHPDREWDEIEDKIGTFLNIIADR